METTYLDVDRRVGSWLVTTDHKRIGILFIVTTTFFMFVGGFFALLLRLEHLTHDATIMGPHTYNRFFTLHGVIMVFLFMIPAIPSGFGNFLLPIMIGAKDVAFPRLNLVSFYLYALACVVVIGGALAGGADTGWTFYTPYSTITTTKVVPVAVGVFIAGLSSIATGVNFITTIHTMRARGLTFMKLPLFVWTLYGTSIIQILATPVLGVSLIIVGIDAAFDWGIFDPARGGDPVLFQHLFWFYSHPAVYIMVLPAMGVITEVVCTFARKNPLSYFFLAASTLGIAFVGFLTWGHHMFVSGMSTFDAGAFGLLSMLVGIFSAIKVFTWIGTLYKGAITVTTPLVYVFAFIFLFIFGGMTGVAFAATSLDVHWHDTYFVVAHFHFIMVGGVMTAWLAALHYWFPLLTGRDYPERWGLLAAVLVFIGFNLTFVPQFLLGNAGMPRRYYQWVERFTDLNVMSTIGSWSLALGLVITLLYLAGGVFTGRKTGRNPWRSAGFEWRVPAPPPPHNYTATPELAHGHYEYAEEVTGA